MSREFLASVAAARSQASRHERASTMPSARSRKVRKLPLADDALGIVGVGADDAAGLPLVVGNRAVGKRVVRFLRIAVALHDEELFLDVGSFRAVHGLIEHRSDLVPDFRPHFRRGPAERPRMLAADDRLVWIVVKVEELMAPADPDRLTRIEHHADRGLQTLRPRARFAERRGGPVVTARQLSQFPAACQEGRRSRKFLCAIHRRHTCRSTI